MRWIWINTGRKRAFAWISGLAGLLAAVGCGDDRAFQSYQGYVEAEYVYVASPQGGELRSLDVQRGQTVDTGTLLFELDPEPEATLSRQAAEKVRQAEAELDDLQKGQRPSELAAMEAKRDQAQVSLELAALEFKRLDKLYQENVASTDDLDRARATRDLYRAQVAQFNADLETGRLGGRADAIRAAMAAVAAARAEWEQARWTLSQKIRSASGPALVHDTLYRPGEWVAPGQPVVVLLPPSYLKVRFFVPQAHLAQVRPQTRVEVSFDGAPKTYEGNISYVSTEAEFTPPVIYSRQTRAKLVFMVEAQFASEPIEGLRPGQPVDVVLRP